MSRTRNLVFASTLALAAGFCAMAPAKAADTLSSRVHNQKARIHAGIQDGSLTGAEASRLKNREHQIRELHARLENQGGGLSDKDHGRIKRELNEQSTSIHNQSTDDDVRGK
jgi:hypothetical protein